LAVGKGDAIGFRKLLKIAQTAALLVALVLIVNLAVHGWLGAILEATAAFLALAIAVNLAVYGWLGVVGAWPEEEADTSDRLAHLLIAAVSTVMAVGTWYALSFMILPFG
jgi:hypothetical protein